MASEGRCSFVADQAAKDAIRLTDMTIDCEERRIFADDETVGRAHYSHGGIVYISGGWDHCRQHHLHVMTL